MPQGEVTMDSRRSFLSKILAPVLAQAATWTELTTTGGEKAMRKITDDNRRRELYGLLGELPERHRPISTTLISKEDRPSYTMEKLQLDLNGLEPVPAYFVRP